MKKNDHTLVATLSTLYQQHTSDLMHYLALVSMEQVAQLTQLITTSSKQNIHFTGVGKSGHVAQKLAATFASCGLRAFYLCASNALHGDIGVVSEKDLVIFLSRSGQTKELINLASFVKERKARIASIICAKKSRLSFLSECAISLPLEKETGQWDMIPTLSSTIQLIIGDLIALAYVQSKELSTDLFATNHPAGSIGQRLSLKVEDLMVSGNELPIASRNANLAETLAHLSSKGSGCVLIVDAEWNLEGIFTDGDLRRALQRHGHNILTMSLKSLMTPHPRYVTHNTLAYDALKQMEANPRQPITILPVLNDKKVCGLVRLHDLLQAGI